jgi:hypothetical protein
MCTFGLAGTRPGATSSAISLTSSTALPAMTSPAALQGGVGAANLAVTARGTCVVTAELALASPTASYTYAVVLTVT